MCWHVDLASSASQDLDVDEGSGCGCRMLTPSDPPITQPISDQSLKGRLWGLPKVVHVLGWARTAISAGFHFGWPWIACKVLSLR